MELSMILGKARSLLPKVYNLRAIIAVAQPSLICVTGTWLQVETPDAAVSIPGYNVHRCDRRNSRGGSCAIYSKSELRANPIDDSSLQGIPEAIWISIEQTKRPVLVDCIYLQPALSPASIADLSRMISNANDLPHSSKFVLGNFKLPDISWSPTLGPTRYASLLAQLGVEGWSQIVSRPTRNLHTSDLLFSNEGHLATAAVGSHFPGSDRCVVSCNAVRYGATVPPNPPLFHLLPPYILLAFSYLLVFRDCNDFFLSSNTQRNCDIFYQNLLNYLHLASRIKGFHPGISPCDKLLKALDNKIHGAGGEHRKFRDFSLLLLINKVSTDRESLRVPLECHEESTTLKDPSRCKLFSRLFLARCTTNSHSVTCLRSTEGSFTTDLVNISNHLNAYFANCYLPLSQTQSRNPRRTFHISTKG
ncbi:U4/U6.U5 tri-snRNP component SNU23 [Clonorchis sinensis]|uniref:U4/U6.U5 tri-snRNP component SNU23 n=1 Tax=Clonorchis sinensis TaxID=79923 RepID=G7YM66_CLOSI|nr:U4/U6.U5 tri-snRNP component SNU23 [Clonorchis sinensis]